MSETTREIERKFLMSSYTFKDLKLVRRCSIQQAYFTHNATDITSPIRVSRNSIGQCFLTLCDCVYVLEPEKFEALYSLDSKVLIQEDRKGTLFTFDFGLNPQARVVRMTQIVPVRMPTYYRLTIKAGFGVDRTEIEIDITEESFNNALKVIGHSPIKKDYHKYEFNGRYLQCGPVDEGDSESFIYGEIEFDSIEAAHAYELTKIPAFIKEVTNDSNYAISGYWMRTRCREEVTSSATR